MLTKEQKDQDTSSQSPGSNPDPIQQHYDDAFNGIASNYGDTAEHPKGDKETTAVADAEKNAESATDLNASSNDKNTPEKSFYNDVDKTGSSAGGIKNAFISASPAKKGAGIGGVIGIIIMIYAFFSFLPIFQLVHLAESLDLAFDAQTRRITSRRAALHYKLALNGEYFEKTGLTGRMAKGYASLDPKALLEDLQKKGSLNGTDLKLDSQGRVTINGEVIDGKLKAQRLRVGELLQDAYPQDKWFKRHARANTAYKAMGIKRVFFEDTKKKWATWELEMISRLRQRLSGTTAVRVGGVDGSQAEAEANELDKALAESPENVPDPINDIDVDKVAQGATPNIGAAGALGAKSLSLTGGADALCDAKYYLKGIELAAIVARHKALVGHAGGILVAAHQLKTGKGVSGAQVSGLMSIINRNPGIGASGSYQLFSGNKNAKVKHTDELALNFNNADGFAGGLSKLNSIIDNGLNKIEDVGQVDPNSYCKLSRNYIYQGASILGGIALTIGGVVGGVGTGGTSTVGVLGKVAAQFAVALSVEGIKLAARPYLIRAMTGPEAIIHYGDEQKGDFLGDALFGGALATTSGERYQAGMTQSLDGAQVVEIENSIALEKNAALKEESIFTKYFAIGNVDSQLSKQLAIMPSTPTDAAQSASQNIASLPKSFISALSLFTPQGKAYAADNIEGNPYITQNPLGITMYGTTDAKINEINDKYDVIENEDWIRNPANGGIEEYQKWVNECYPADNPTMLYGMPLDEDQESILEDKCSMQSDEKVALTNTDTMSDAGYTEVAATSSSEQEKYERYATYRLDRGIQQGILFMSGATNCIDPDNEDWDCPEIPAVTNEQIQVATFNVNARMFDDDHPSHKWEDRREAIRTVVSQYGVEILGVQEIFDNGMYSDLETMFPEYGLTSNASGSRKNTILYNKTSYQLNTEGDKDLGSNRQLTWARLQNISNGQGVFVANAHLEVENFCLATKQASIVIEEINKINTDGLPVVAMGDFNSYLNDTNGDCKDEVSAPNKFINDGYLYTKEAAVTKVNEEYSSYNGYALPMNKGRHIDYIFIKSGATPLSINDFTVSIDTPGGVIPSDHNALISSIGFSNATSNSASQFVNTDGYAWPVDIYRAEVAANQESNTPIWTCNTRDTCHYEGSPYAIDLTDYRTKAGQGDQFTVGKAVYAIKDGTMSTVKQKDGPGCYGFHIVANDDHDYYYVHTRNPIITSGSRAVKAGEKIAEIGERECTGNNSWPHLHIDRAKKGEINYGTDSRDPAFEDLIVKLHNELTR